MIRELTMEMLIEICSSSEDIELNVGDVSGMNEYSATEILINLYSSSKKIDVNSKDDFTIKLLYYSVKEILTTCFKNGYDLSGLDENIVNIALLYWEGLWQGNDDVSCECIDEEGREVSIRLIQEDHYDQHMEENDPEEYESLSDVKYYVSGAYMWIEWCIYVD